MAFIRACGNESDIATLHTEIVEYAYPPAALDARTVFADAPIAPADCISATHEPKETLPSSYIKVAATEFAATPTAQKPAAWRLSGRAAAVAVAPTAKAVNFRISGERAGTQAVVQVAG